MDRDILLTIAFIITFPLLCLIAPLSFITYNYLQILLGKAPSRSKTRHAKTMVVLGSGGHTAEMLALVRALDHQHYTPRIYVAADTDNHSITRALTQEQTLQQAASKVCGEVVFSRGVWSVSYILVDVCCAHTYALHTHGSHTCHPHTPHFYLSNRVPAKITKNTILTTHRPLMCAPMSSLAVVKLVSHTSHLWVLH